MDLSNPEIAEKCNYLSQLFNLTNDDLFVHWEAFKYQSHENPNTKPTIDLLEKLQQYIQDFLNKQKSKSNDIHTIKKRKLQSSSNGNVKIVKTFNDSINSKETTISNKNFKIIGDFTPQKYNYKTMNLKLLEIADYIDDRITSFQNLFINSNLITSDQLGNPSLQSQSEIYTIGRIVPDSPDATSNLNIHSLYLETSRSLGFGYRVPLDFSKLNSNSNSNSFFPGQIVCLKGINPTGNQFNVLESLTPPYLGSTSFTESEITQFSDSIGDDNLKIAILSGPYHSRNSLDFTNLEKMINHLNNNVKPDLVLLTGPFIDSSSLPQIIQSLLSSSEDNSDLRTIDDLFSAYLQPILSTINANKKIIIPHSNDASFSPHTSYPQPRFERRALNLDKSFKCFPNPSIFSVNELTIGVSTADILRDLKDITTTNDSTSSRIDRIVNHLLTQRSFYPLQNSQSIQIDPSFLGLAEFDTVLPDLLILPSVITPFAKCVKNVLIINPGSVIHNSFALLQVKSPDISDMTPVQNTWLASAWKRSRVDLLTLD